MYERRFPATHGFSIEEKLITYWLHAKHLRNGCVVHSGAKSPMGYGFTKYKGKIYGLHRLVWVFFKSGVIRKGLYVCHSCDTRSCINPDHLFLGTATENMMDCSKKNRLSKGILHHNSKLNSKNVRWIRSTSFRLSQRKQAGILNVDRSTIAAVIKNETWTHIK